MFKVGDRVKLIVLVSSGGNDDFGDPLWEGKCGKIGGTIISLDSGNSTYPIKVKWDNKHYNIYQDFHLGLMGTPVELFRQNAKELSKFL